MSSLSDAYHIDQIVKKNSDYKIAAKILHARPRHETNFFATFNIILNDF